MSGSSVCHAICRISIPLWSLLGWHEHSSWGFRLNSPTPRLKEARWQSSGLVAPRFLCSTLVLPAAALTRVRENTPEAYPGSTRTYSAAWFPKFLTEKNGSHSDSQLLILEPIFTEIANNWKQTHFSWFNVSRDQSDSPQVPSAARWLGTDSRSCWRGHHPRRAEVTGRWFMESFKVCLT